MIEKVRVMWQLGWGNLPIPQLLVGEAPPARFKRSGGLYYREDENGIAVAYNHVPPHTGFGGNVIKANMEDGTVDSLVGPWWVGSSYINKFFGPVTECHVTSDKAVMERGYSFSSAYVSINKLAEALDRLRPDLVIISVPAYTGEELGGMPLSAEQDRVVFHGTNVKPSGVSYAVVARSTMGKMGLKEAISAGDKPHMTGVFEELHRRLGIDTVDEFDRAQKEIWCYMKEKENSFSGRFYEVYDLRLKWREEILSLMEPEWRHD